MTGDYIIIGDTPKYKDVLICVCCSNRENATKVLERMTTNPTEDDKKLIKDATNLRIKHEKAEDCWWRYGCD